jgi:GntR family transcriptional repressor for pyruvate dehydrogenase complex
MSPCSSTEGGLLSTSFFSYHDQSADSSQNLDNTHYPWYLLYHSLFIISSYQLKQRGNAVQLDNMYTPIQSSKVFEKIAEQIEKRILSGELRSGDRLPTERELSEQFQASRTAVREAMKTLAQRGLVDMRPGRGTIVIDGTSQAMRHSLGLMMMVGQAGNSANLVEVREIIEPGIAALAAVRATEEEITAMREAVRVMDSKLNEADAFIAADNDFHRALAKGTQNVLILTLVDSIVDLLSEQRTQIFSLDGAPERGQIHHKRILDSIVRHDAEAAREAMRAHLQQVREDVKNANIPVD